MAGGKCVGDRTGDVYYADCCAAIFSSWPSFGVEFCIERSEWLRSTWVGVRNEEKVPKEGAGRRKCVFVCEWFGMGGGNSLHASIFFFFFFCEWGRTGWSC